MFTVRQDSSKDLLFWYHWHMNGLRWRPKHNLSVWLGVAWLISVQDAGLVVGWNYFWLLQVAHSFYYIKYVHLGLEWCYILLYCLYSVPICCCFFKCIWLSAVNISVSLWSLNSGDHTLRKKKTTKRTKNWAFCSPETNEYGAISVQLFHRSLNKHKKCEPF